MKITPKVLRQWGACYPDEKIAELFGDRKSVSIDEVLAAEIPVKDRLWVLLRSPFLSNQQLRMFAYAYAAADTAADAAASVAADAVASAASAAYKAAYEAAYEAEVKKLLDKAIWYMSKNQGLV